jgi:hypothetical protein
MSEEKAHRLLQDILPLGRFREDAKPFKVTAHRYNPGYDSGPVGLLNLKRHRLEALIEQGYNDAVSHDCKANGCILVEDT